MCLQARLEGPNARSDVKLRRGLKLEWLRKRARIIAKLRFGSKIALVVMKNRSRLQGDLRPFVLSRQVAKISKTLEGTHPYPSKFMVTQHGTAFRPLTTSGTVRNRDLSSSLALWNRNQSIPHLTRPRNPLNELFHILEPKSEPNGAKY
jgi:hypothetical protein